MLTSCTKEVLGASVASLSGGMQLRIASSVTSGAVSGCMMSVSCLRLDGRKFRSGACDGCSISLMAVFDGLPIRSIKGMISSSRACIS